MDKTNRLNSMRTASPRSGFNVSAGGSHGINAGSAMDYIHRAENCKIGIDDAIALYRKAVQAAQYALPTNAFLDWAGEFWQMPETRIYMHARSSLAQLLRRRGSCIESVEHFRDLMRLNPQDNQGNRWYFAPALLDAALIDPAYYNELEQLLQKYAEPFANMMYSKVLFLYRKQGASNEAKSALRQAMQRNPYVIDLLLQDPPRTAQIRDHYIMGSRDEAQNYVHEAWLQWRDTPGAIDFIYDTVRAEQLLATPAAS